MRTRWTCGGTRKGRGEKGREGTNGYRLKFLPQLSQWYEVVFFEIRETTRAMVKAAKAQTCQLTAGKPQAMMIAVAAALTRPQAMATAMAVDENSEPGVGVTRVLLQ